MIINLLHFLRFEIYQNTLRHKSDYFFDFLPKKPMIINTIYTLAKVPFAINFFTLYLITKSIYIHHFLRIGNNSLISPCMSK